MNAPVVIAAGGTGGHLFPAQSLAAELIRRGLPVVLATDPRGRNYGEQFPGVTVATTASASPSAPGLLGKARAGATIAWGIAQSLLLLRRTKPLAVVGFGGYPAFPTMVAASVLGLPTVLHEQNAVLGRVNRAVAARMDAIAASFPIAQGLPEAAKGRVTVTGNPVRPSVLDAAGSSYDAPGGAGPIRVLIFGGSQGARIFTDVAPEALTLLPKELRGRIALTQQARPEDVERARAAYAALGLASAELAPFFTDIAQRLAAAHLVVCRAGASTVTELCAVGRPALLVPYPFATDDHQRFNAQVLTEAGAARAVLQTDFTPQRLAAELSELLGDPGRLRAMAAAARRLAHAQAAERLADLVERTAAARASRRIALPAGGAA